MSRLSGNPQARQREEKWIAWIDQLQGPLASPHFPLGIGDDAALWRPRPDCEVVLTVDTQVEKTHFELGWLTPREVGRRAVSSSVSDLAAMAARPAALLVSLLLEGNTSESTFHQIARGIHDASVAYRAPVVGGNISRGPLSISITALGEVSRRSAITRAGARPGDEVWVTGCPGLAHVGLQLLKHPPKRPARSLPVRAALRAYRYPAARLQEAAWLSRHWPLTAMIDLSDGLGKDLRHVAEASRQSFGRPLGIVLEVTKIQEIVPLQQACLLPRLSPIRVALTGGEDYELCFTASPRRQGRASAVRAFERRFSLELTCIGTVVDFDGQWLRQSDGSLQAARFETFEHL